PGVAWFDLNGDGWDDIIVASGRGGRPGVFLNDQHGGFQAVSDPPFNLPVTRDQTTVLGWNQPNGRRILLAGSSNYEDGFSFGPSVRQYDPTERRIDDTFPGQLSSPGPLAQVDFDGDGQLDLFVGGRCVPGRSPEPATSLVFRQSGGHWQLDPDNSRPLRNLGLVSGAVWSDLDGDGWPELILAC